MVPIPAAFTPYNRAVELVEKSKRRAVPGTFEIIWLIPRPHQYSFQHTWDDRYSFTNGISATEEENKKKKKKVDNR